MDHLLVQEKVLPGKARGKKMWIVPFLMVLTFSISFAKAESRSPQQVDLYFPTPVLEGTDLTMNCRFRQDQNTSIYQVKWYKGIREIFRYTQKESPPKKIFPLAQVRVDESHSDMNKLVIRKVPLAMRGNISCEVSWEPQFHTVTKTHQLVVVSAPSQKPSLTVEFYKSTKTFSPTGTELLGVRPGDNLTAYCTSGSANPAPNITFYINENPVSPNPYRRDTLNLSEEVREGENRTEVRTSTLHLKLTFINFVNKKIRIRCEATLFNLYNASSDVYEATMIQETALRSSSSLGGGGMYRSSATKPSLSFSSAFFGSFLQSITTSGIVMVLLSPFSLPLLTAGETKLLRVLSPPD